MIEWKLIVITGCICLLIWVVWSEFRRENRHWITSRIVAGLISVAALACIALPLTIKRNMPGNHPDVILLTEGFNQDSINGFVSSLAVPPVFITFDGQLAQKPGVKYAADLSAYIQDNSNIHVFGYGLTKADLRLLQDRSFIFHAPARPGGIQSAYWSRKVYQGEPFIFSGTYRNETAKTINLQLTSFGKTLDSLSVPPNSLRKFSLQVIPASLGKSVYRFMAIQRKDTLQNEPVPAEVIAGKKVRVLMLASSPDFENKFLKNWLGQQGYEVVLFTATSKNKKQSEFVNTPIAAGAVLNEAILSKADVLITDQTALASLSAGNEGLVKRHIEKGLGLVVVADSTGSNRFFASFFLSRNNTNEHLIRLSLADTVYNFPVLKTENQLFIRPAEGTRSIAADKDRHTLIGSVLYGKGRVVYSTIHDTYSWVLADEQPAYSRLWTTIIGNALHSTEQNEEWSINTNIPYVNEPVHVNLQTAATGLPKALIGTEQVALQQHPVLPFIWRGTYWPRKPGWQSIVKTDGSVFWWFAFDKENWRSAAAVEKIANTFNAARSVIHQNKTVAFQTSRQVEINKIYFFLLFLLACSFLWIEDKFYN